MLTALRVEQKNRAKELIDSGAIGEVVTVKSMTHGPSVPHPWMYDLAASNGPLAEVSSHDIDTVRWLCGSEVTSVYATGGIYRSPQAREEFPDLDLTIRGAISIARRLQGPLAELVKVVPEWIGVG